MDLRFDNGPWQIVQGHDLILMRPEVYDVSSCGTQILHEFRFEIQSYEMLTIGLERFDFIKFIYSEKAT